MGKWPKIIVFSRNLVALKRPSAPSQTDSLHYSIDSPGWQVFKQPLLAFSLCTPKRFAASQTAANFSSAAAEITIYHIVRKRKPGSWRRRKAMTEGVPPSFPLQLSPRGTGLVTVLCRLFFLGCADCLTDRRSVKGVMGLFSSADGASGGEGPPRPLPSPVRAIGP